MTQEELASTAGCSRVFVAQLESGKRKDVSLSRARALAESLGVSLDDLVAPSTRSGAPRELAPAARRPEEETVWPAAPLLLALAQRLRARGHPFWPAQPVEIDLDTWKTTCPMHAGALVTVGYRRKAGLEVRAACGCSRSKFLRALGLSIADVQGERRLTLRELAAHVGLSEEYLRGLGVRERNRRVEIPYRNEEGEEVAVRLRLALLKTERPDRQRFAWKSGSEPCPYGLDRLGEARRQGYIIVVEGESDAWTCWRAGFVALGLPGADCASMLTFRVLVGIGRVYVVQEADAAGAAFAEEVVERVRLVAPGATVQVLEMPSEAKDLNAVYRRNGRAFRSWLRATVGARTGESCAAPAQFSQG